MIVQFDSVEKSFPIKDIGGPRQKVLRGLSFYVQEGEILGLVGLNGQGKSTTIRLMLGLLYPDRGSIEIFGGKPGEISVKRRISYLPENPHFFDTLNAIEFLRFVGMERGLRGNILMNEIEKMLDVVGLSGSENKAIRKYSKGMVQRLGLAQAFLGSPEFAILDEPLSGLDPLGRKMAKELILNHKKDGKTVFFTSHILEDIENMADRILIMNSGRIAKEISRKELAERSLEEVFVEVIENDKHDTADP